MGEVTDGLVRQVMSFVEDVDGVTWIGQHRTAAKGQVSQNHVVVGDDHIDLGHALARLVERALLKVRAMPAGALTVIRGELRPVRIAHLLRPAVAVAIPAITRQLLDHAGEELLAALVDLDAEAFFLEQLGGRALSLAFLQ